MLESDKTRQMFSGLGSYFNYGNLKSLISKSEDKVINHNGKEYVKNVYMCVTESLYSRN